MPRRSEYTPAKAEAICRRLAAGQWLHDICANAGMPTVATVCRWRAEHPDFDREYGYAQQAKIELLQKQAQEIADDTAADVPKEGSAGAPRRAAYVPIERAKLQILTRFRIIACLQSKRYGAPRRHDESDVDDQPSSDTDDVVRWLDPE